MKIDNTNPNSKLIEDFKKARGYKEMSSCEGYEYFKQDLIDLIERVVDKAGTIGWDTQPQEHDALVRARTLNEVLRVINTKVRSYTRLKASLEAQGIKPDETGE